MTSMPASDINSLQLRPGFPSRIWVVVEQQKGESRRMAYDRRTQSFVATGYQSLLNARGFGGVYGWIGGTGLPPGPHYDVLLFTDGDPTPGAIVAAVICGVFFRSDRDHKFVALDERWEARMAKADLSALPPDAHAELLRLYPVVDRGQGEGWFGADEAMAHLARHPPEHD